MSLMQLTNDAGASVLTRSDNAAAQLIDRHSATAAAQLATAQAECNECATAQSEREATASQSGKLKGIIIYRKEEL